MSVYTSMPKCRHPKLISIAISTIDKSQLSNLEGFLIPAPSTLSVQPISRVKLLEAMAIIVGISGPSSSGKTTLARLLLRVFGEVTIPHTDPTTRLNTFIIHEDDFYLPDDKYAFPRSRKKGCFFATLTCWSLFSTLTVLTVPLRIPYTTTKSGTKIQDWDTAAALDIDSLAQALLYVKQSNKLPSQLQSKEHQNQVTDSGVADALVNEMREHVTNKLAEANLSTTSNDSATIALMEGFLLYSGKDDKGPLRSVHDIIDLPLFLPATYTNVKTRREARSGYATIGPQPTYEEVMAKGANASGEESKSLDSEGKDEPQNFWVDPPGYVDDIVWPRYVEDHAWLLIQDDSVEGDLVARVGEGVNVRSGAGVLVAPGKGEARMDVVLKWAVDEILQHYLARKAHN